MNTITYLRPTGTQITVSDNEANRAYAAENGWTEAKPESKPSAEPKPARKSK